VFLCSLFVFSCSRFCLGTWRVSRPAGRVGHGHRHQGRSSQRTGSVAKLRATPGCAWSGPADPGCSWGARWRRDTATGESEQVEIQNSYRECIPNPNKYFKNFQLNIVFPCFKSQNHRMFRVGRDLCGSSSPTPLPKQGHLQQPVEDLVQVGLEYLQRRRLHNLPGQPVPVLRRPQREEVLPHVQMELSMLQSVNAMSLVCCRTAAYSAFVSNMLYCSVAK